ncbi:MAG: hypothetical protein ABS69_11340 [Nitrosomonadales bacterium SCN 54-20]|nr:MAG: hypothetical protein ABS69_11340 [Nitrosomonadales bacterium SCN 54-20]
MMPCSIPVLSLFLSPYSEQNKTASRPKGSKTGREQTQKEGCPTIRVESAGISRLPRIMSGAERYPGEGNSIAGSNGPLIC